MVIWLVIIGLLLMLPANFTIQRKSAVCAPVTAFSEVSGYAALACWTVAILLLIRSAA